MTTQLNPDLPGTSIRVLPESSLDFLRFQVGCVFKDNVIEPIFEHPNKRGKIIGYKKSNEICERFRLWGYGKTLEEAQRMARNK